MNTPQENPPSFDDFIKLDVPMPPQEAIATLASCHGATTEQVCASFTKLQGFEQGTVTFRKERHYGWGIIVMEGTPTASRFSTWDYLIHPYNGRPLQRTR